MKHGGLWVGTTEDGTRTLKVVAGWLVAKSENIRLPAEWKPRLKRVFIKGIDVNCCQNRNLQSRRKVPSAGLFDKLRWSIVSNFLARLSDVALLFDFISCGSDASQHLSLLHTPSSIAPPFALRKLIRLTAWTARACASYRNETALAEGARIYSRSFLSLQGLLSLLHLFWSAIEEEGRPQ